MSTEFINLAQQCCDADEYLDMGYMCAKAGMCYNPLRPIGDTLWFSIPYVLNTNEQILFYLHLALLALLAASTFYLFKKLLPTALFVVAVIFLNWPTFFHSLSDTPATLLFVEGIVLALIAQGRNSARLFFASGLALGLSAFLRAAYLYPLLLAGGVFLLYWLWQKNRQWPAVFIISFFIPLSLQFFSTWKYTAQWHYLSEGRSNSIMNFHLHSDATGYDTYLPQSGLYWSPDCPAAAGLLPSIKATDIDSTWCILKNRLAFYLGSYAMSTYLGTDTRNFFDHNKSEKIVSARKDASGYIIEIRSLLPLPTGLYRYRVLLHGESDQKQQDVHLQINQQNLAPATTGPAVLLEKPVLDKTITVRDTAQPYSVDLHHTDTGYLAARITSPAIFYVQSAALEPAAMPPSVLQTSAMQNAVIGQDTLFAKNNRVFSSAYLVINGLVILFAVLSLYTSLAKTHAPIFIFITTLLLVVFLQCLAIIPEQRYLQGFLCACWLLCLSLLSRRYQPS